MFETALLLLLSTCFSCHQAGAVIQKAVIGSFLRVTQLCRRCGKQYKWDSQPHIGTSPAGNILISSAILFTGSLPAKALQIFKVLNCASITRSTYYRHQTHFLQPAVRCVWRRQQTALLDALKEKGKPLVLAGDGRADSPGHCAKYGSYTFVELTCSKVVDFQLIQVLYLYTQFCVSIMIIITLFVYRVMGWVAVTTWKKKDCSIV